ncbi:hypothetical protein BC567DRAFT_59078 [Phyllosticta citribraziliensis]
MGGWTRGIGTDGLHCNGSERREVIAGEVVFVEWTHHPNSHPPTQSPRTHLAACVRQKSNQRRETENTTTSRRVVMCLPTCLSVCLSTSHPQQIERAEGDRATRPACNFVAARHATGALSLAISGVFFVVIVSKDWGHRGRMCSWYLLLSVGLQIHVHVADRDAPDWERCLSKHCTTALSLTSLLQFLRVPLD